MLINMSILKSSEKWITIRREKECKRHLMERINILRASEELVHLTRRWSIQYLKTMV
jgi:hypothetical protein